MVPIKEEIALTLVVGAPLVGKTTWCKEQQLKLPGIFIIPFDELIYRLRATPNISKHYYDVVANTVYDMIWELSELGKDKHILIDGFPLDIQQMERFVQMTKKISVFQLLGNDLLVLGRNTKLKIEERRWTSEALGKRVMNTRTFFKSPEFTNLVEFYDVTYQEFSSNSSTVNLKTIVSTMT